MDHPHEQAQTSSSPIARLSERTSLSWCRHYLKKDPDQLGSYLLSEMTDGPVFALETAQFSRLLFGIMALREHQHNGTTPPSVITAGEKSYVDPQHGGLELEVFPHAEGLRFRGHRDWLIDLKALQQASLTLPNRQKISPVPVLRQERPQVLTPHVQLQAHLLINGEWQELIDAPTPALPPVDESVEFINLDRPTSKAICAWLIIQERRMADGETDRPPEVFHTDQNTSGEHPWTRTVEGCVIGKQLLIRLLLEEHRPDGRDVQEHVIACTFKSLPELAGVLKYQLDRPAVASAA